MYIAVVSVYLSNLFWVAVGWPLSAPGSDLSLSSRIPALQSVICGGEEVKTARDVSSTAGGMGCQPQGAQRCRCAHRASSGADAPLAALRSLEQPLLSHLQQQTVCVSVALYPGSKVCLVFWRSVSSRLRHERYKYSLCAFIVLPCSLW